jgi:hypothetical protein
MPKKSVQTIILGLLFFVALPGPASAVTLFFNSYGWSDIYYMPAGSSTGAANKLGPDNLLDTAFLSQADRAPNSFIYGTSFKDVWRINYYGSVAAWDKILTLADSASGGFAWSPTGELYTSAGGNLRKVDFSNGATLSTVNLPDGFFSLITRGIDFGSDGTLYAADSTKLYTINTTTGVSTAIFDAGNVSHGVFSDIDFGDDGVLRALTSFDYMLQYNPATQIGTWSIWTLTYNGSDFSPSSLVSVPEPTMFFLFSAALLSVRFRRTITSSALPCAVRQRGKIR